MYIVTDGKYTKYLNIYLYYHKYENIFLEIKISFDRKWVFFTILILFTFVVFCDWHSRFFNTYSSYFKILDFIVNINATENLISQLSIVLIIFGLSRV